jgi:flagellar secretion chaperone FliS
MFSPRNHLQAGTAALGQMYRRMSVETEVIDANPHRLVAMLFDGLIDSIVTARSHLAKGDVAAKGEAIGRAVRIIEEGLKAGLNLQAGGGLATDLQELYAYLTMRLTQANLRNDDAALDECKRLVGTLRDAWQAIAPAANRRPDA